MPVSFLTEIKTDFLVEGTETVKLHLPNSSNYYSIFGLTASVIAAIIT
jgi:hypothetical protein